MIRIAYHPCYYLDLPEGHRFPMDKYRLLPEQLLYEGLFQSENFFAPDKIALDKVSRVHTQAYIDKLLSLQLSKQEIRKSGFPLSQALVDREQIIAQGTINNVHYAIESGVSMNIAGGTHHAFSDRAEAFCFFNDQAIAAQYVLDQGIAQRVAIIDLDVHQGNGTAEIFSTVPEVFTFSMHGKANYPFKKEQSDLDVELDSSISDEAYLQLLEQHLKEIHQKFEPQFIFYLSGVDILKSDKLGKLNLSIQACKRRDTLVLSYAKHYQIPVQISMGGGYSPQLRTIVDAHTNTFREAHRIFA
ncbi:MAG: histone deacetylase [Flavobacteriaceae bacterium]|nr:histone deacetylase [Flavobacteriaceae bacterium]